MDRTVSEARAEARHEAEASQRTEADRRERAALVGLAASFFAIASGAALATFEDALHWPALITFFASLSLAVWARRVVGPRAPSD